MARSGLRDEEAHIRAGAENDLDSIGRIQAGSPQAAQWDVRDYLKYDLLVGMWGECLAGFVVSRRVAEGENELLNLAVAPAFRRRGVGRRLVAELTNRHPGTLWLEVRESNTDARNFYKTLGFSEAGKRSGYYADSCESAIVMNVHS